MILLSEWHFDHFCCKGILFTVAVQLGELCKTSLTRCSGAGIKGTKFWGFACLFFCFVFKLKMFHFMTLVCHELI